MVVTGMSAKEADRAWILSKPPGAILIKHTPPITKQKLYSYRFYTEGIK
jgi:hypothetical protein